jgi:hypothetical protein
VTSISTGTAPRMGIKLSENELRTETKHAK